MSMSKQPLAVCNISQALQRRINASSTPALKGRAMKAQGAALGNGHQFGPQALKGRDRLAQISISLFQSLGMPRSLPRAAPWAFTFVPFRAFANAKLTARKPNRPHPAFSPTEGVSRGFTLLEVILSLAILAGALAALGEVMRLADRSASTAEDETHAQIIAASIMDELSAGSRELTAISQSPLDTGDDPPWLYSVQMGQTQYDELVSVRVRVEQDLEPRLQPAQFELVRWMPNPDYVPPNTGDDSSTSSTTGSSSSTSGSSATSGSGGQK
jgi:type II secretion system protein I